MTHNNTEVKYGIMQCWFKKKESKTLFESAFTTL